MNFYKCALTLVILGLFLPNFSLAADRQASTPEERARLVQITNQVVRDPLSAEKNNNDVEWALELVYEVPDIRITVCSDVLGPLQSTHFRYKALLRNIHLLAQAAYASQHPDASDMEVEQNITATHAVLAAYSAIVAQKPNSAVKDLDDWKQMETAGSLEAHIRQMTMHCRGNWL